MRIFAANTICKFVNQFSFISVNKPYNLLTLVTDIKKLA
jgi:hypothetical protein